SDLSACSRRPCQNGATCVMDDGGDYTCLCPPGYHGNNCQLKVGPCLQERSRCMNGGVCEDADGFAVAWACRCLAGFTGRRCESDVDDCLMAPCANGATCVDAANRFLCVCPPGFTGRFCTVNLDDCASRPCQHAGRCLDRAAGFLCVCRPGYAGATCETPLLGGDGGGGSQLATGGKSQSSGNGSWNVGGKGGGNFGGNVDWSGGGNFGENSSGNVGQSGDRLLKVTVSERGDGGGLTRLQITVLLVLAGATLGVVALTAGLVLQRRCRDCDHAPCGSHAPCSWTLTSRWRRGGEPERQISFLNVAEPEKKKLNTEVI
ncbi:protein delta homolog 2, partial [Etheostoma cragini]|uniref:protein delta homolog 2 n=1 Tax=Etheostoma cragini TaxID=417921 RepID=UPI00155EA1E9